MLASLTFYLACHLDNRDEGEEGTDGAFFAGGF
jgi:hypothetical protein